MFEPDFENPLFKLSYFRHKLNKILSNDIIEQEKYNKIIEHLEQEEKSIWNNYSNLYLTNQAESEECLEQQLFYLKNKNIIDEETFNKFAQSWQIKKFITITDPNKQTQKNTSEKLESSNEFSISFEKEKIKENDKRNMIEVLVEKISGKWFVFLGVMLMVLSSFPIIREINSNSLIYLVLLLYSIGLFGSGYLTRKYFPWTGNVFYLVSILITPVILASVTSLDFYNKVDLLIACFTFVSIPLINYLVLKTLYNKLRFSYFIIFVLLGLSAALPAKIQDLFSQLNLLNSDFETLTLLLLFSLLFLGSKILNNDLKIDKTSNNVKPILILHSLLIYIYFILISSNNFSLQSYGLIVILIASLLWNIAQKIKCLIKVDNIEVNILPMLKNIIISGYILSFISPIISFSDISKFIITCFIGLIMYVFNQDLFKQSSTKDELSVFGNHQNKYLKFFNNIMGGLFFNSFMYFILILWNLTNDIQSMIISITMLIIVLLANIKKFEKWKESFYFISILTSIDIWAKISLFDSWSSYTFISMFILSSIYLLNSIYYKRNVLSYVSIVTFSIAYFSLITVINPAMSFYNYRYYAVLLSFLYLSSGYFIQLRFSNSNKIDLNKKEVIKSSMTLKTLFNDDTVNPYRFQDRFSSIFPYLISEPLYNLALLMTSFSVLVNLKDYTLSIPATIFYILVFKIYPSRLWIYFALTSVTSGFIGFITGVIPDKYQNWGFIFISFNWFFVGTIVEEFFEAYERKNNNLFHQEKKYAQPFFQVALIINILLLRYFFVDLQNITSPEGLKKVQEELLPIVFTSFFYILKMRVYVSKLWLYPCIIISSLVIYFKSLSFLGAEFNLIVMTIISFLCLFAGNYLNNSKKIMKYVENIVNHKLPKLSSDSKYYTYHLYDFASPFYTFAFLSASVSLVISAILIPKYSLLLASNFSFANGNLNFMTLNFYIIQLFNFTLLSLFFAIYYPKKIMLLDGSFKELITPKELKYLPSVAIILNIFWLFNYYVKLDNIMILLSGTSLVWALFYGLSLQIKKTLDNHYYVISSLLAAFSLIFATYFSIFNPSNNFIITSLEIATVSFMSLIIFSKESNLLYFIEFSLLLLMYYSFDYFHYDKFILIYIFCVINLIFWLFSDKFSKQISNVFYKNMILFSVLFPLFIIISQRNDLNLTLYSFMGAILYFTISLLDKSKLYAGFSIPMLGIFLFLISTSPDTYLFSFIGIVFCYIFHAYRMEIIKNPRFENFKLSIHIFTLIFPITVFVMSYLSSHFYSYLIYSLLQIMLYSWIAYTEKNDNLRKFLWWLTAILVNIMEIFVLIRFDLLYAQIVFSSIGLSFILLSKIQKNVKDINQYLYLGQIFLLASPFLHENPYFGIKLPLIEFFMTLGLFIFASFKIKRKAFLSLNVFLILTSISIGILLSFFNGNWIVRWGILLFLGSIITVIGTQIETKKEIFKKYINSASNFLKEWD